MEQAASDLKAASLAVNKLGHVFDNFQSHAFSILALSEQWRNLQGSFTMAESSFSTHTKLLESKESQFGAVSTNLDNLQQEVVLRQRKLESAEKSVSERIEAVAVREKHIQEFRDVMELEKGRISEHSRALECREKRFEERCVEVEEREKRLEARCMEVEVREKLADEVMLDVEGRENRIEERCRVVGVKERQIDERCQAAELEEERIVKRWIELEKRGKEMDLREQNLNKAALVVELKEKEVNEGLERKLKEFESRQIRMFKETRETLELREKDVDLKERCLNERAHELDQKEKEVNERFEVRWKELELRELQLKETREALELGGREIDLKEKDLIDRAQTLELKEKELNDAFKENSKDRNEIDLRELHLSERAQQFELKEKELNGAFEVNNKELKKASEALELKEKEMDSRELHLNERSQELELKRKELNKAFERDSKDLELKQVQIKEASEALELKEKEMELKEKQMSERRERLELKEKEADEHSQALELKEKKLNEVIAAMESKVNQTDQGCKKMDLKGKEISVHCGEKLIDALSKVLRLKEKEVIELPLALKPEEKQIHEPSEAQLLQEKRVDGHHCNSSKVSSLFRNMDTYGVRSFLIELVEEELDILHVEIFNALRYAVDPPKLVLDVCRLHETNTVEYDAFRHKAIFLLDILMNIAPDITSDVKDRATSYAVTWRARLKNTQVDTCGFLLFVAAYKLATSFEAYDLFLLFGTLYHDHEVYRPDLHIKLCCALGILDKIPGHIGSFIGRKNWLEAVRLICVFKMECQFPPVPMLNAHVKFVRQEIEKLPDIGTSIQKAENVKKEISALETLLKFLYEFKLTSQISTESILGYMRQLEKMSKTTESYIKKVIKTCHINANSQNKECNNSSGHAVFRPVNFQAELQVGLKRSLTPPECQAEKLPRVEVFNHVTPPCSTTSAPWPQPRPCSFGQATNVYAMPHVTSTWPRVPFPDSAIGSRPNFSPIQRVAPPHMEICQHVAPPAYLGGPPLPFYGGNGQASCHRGCHNSI